MLMTPARSALPAHRGTGGYTAPTDVKTVRLRDLLYEVQRGPMFSTRQLDIFKDSSVEPDDLTLYYAGDLNLFSRPCVSIVGSRQATSHGLSRASRLAREITERGVVVVSGLAKGIDSAAQLTTIENGGQTVAVIGTPLSKVTPVENGPLQETIWRDHLLVSPFAEGTTILRSNFPKRNEVMAALSDATVIVEAEDNSGTLHQAVACQKLGRWLFILKSVVDTKAWPKRFLHIKNTCILERADQIFDALGLR
jgi:DNA protecting protein DprA